MPFPTLNLAVGRSNDLFVFGNGRVVHGAYFTQTMFDACGVESFQYHQVTADHIILKVVRGSRFGPADEAAIKRAEELIRQHSDGTTRLEVQFVADIPASRVGKHRFTRSDVSVVV